MEQLQSGQAKSQGLYTADGPEARLLAYLPGHDSLKPLDCVGTQEEAVLAMWLTERRRTKWAERLCVPCGPPSEARPPTQRGPLAQPAYLSTDRWHKVKAGLERDAASKLALLDEYNEENNHPPWFGKVARKLHDERWKLPES